MKALSIIYITIVIGALGYLAYLYPKEAIVIGLTFGVGMILVGALLLFIGAIEYLFKR